MIKNSYHPNCTIRNSYRANCTIGNCYLAICTIANSYLANSMITNSYLANCTIGNKLRRFDQLSLLTQWVKPLGLISHLTTSRWVSLSLREKCPNTKFFWSVFTRIWIEYGDLLRKSLYSVRIRVNTAQKRLRIWTLFTQWVMPTYLVAITDNKRLKWSDKPLALSN